MVVDQTPFLKKALSTCRRLRKELHLKQALLSDFEEQDQSAFQQWFNSTHGNMLTQIRELSDEAAAYRFILHHLSDCSYSDYEAVPALFDELFELKKKGTLYSYVPPQQPDPFGFDEDDEDDDHDDAWEEDDDEDEDEDDEDMRAFFDRMFGGAGSSGDSSAGRSEGKSAEKAASNARLKTCYRTLAKRLHPDHSKLEESIRKKRWHEIQEAYQSGDLEALKRVEAICDMDDSGLSAELGLARLHELAAYHQSHLTPIRRALREAKQNIAFGFSKYGPSARVKRSVSADLKNERRDVGDILAHMKYSAELIRKEVAVQIKENKAAKARAVRRAEEAKARQAERREKKPIPKAKAKRAAPKAAPKVAPKVGPKAKVPREKNLASEDPDQMSFFL
jgi:hypothetical protein